MSSEDPRKEPAYPHLRTSDLLATYLGAMLLTAFLTFLFTRFDLHPAEFPAVLLGWGLALIGALIGSGIKFIALRGDFGWFMIWALGVNGMRALLFIAIIVAAHQRSMAHFRPFLIAALAGYFCCLFGEVLLLHRISLQTWSKK